MSISEILYSYGSVNEANRKIEFSEKGNTLEARVSFLEREVWVFLSMIPEDRIVVEMDSVAVKVKTIMLARQANISPGRSYEKDLTSSLH